MGLGAWRMVPVDRPPPPPRSSVAAPFVKVFEPRVFENLPRADGKEGGVYIESERSLRDYCRKNKVASSALL